MMVKYLERRIFKNNYKLYICEFTINYGKEVEECYTEDDLQLFSISKFFIFSIFKSVGIES